MGKSAKTVLREKRAWNLTKNLSQAAKRTYDAVKDSPKKLMSVFTLASPGPARKKMRSNTVCPPSYRDLRVPEQAGDRRTICERV
jgi:hypothetical protein